MVKKNFVKMKHKIKENLEKILDGLATEANQASAELDEINVEIQGVKRGTERSTRSPHAIEHKRGIGSII